VYQKHQHLPVNHPLVLAHFKSERKDRDHPFFKGRPLSVALFSDDVQEKWRLAAKPEEYPYSSASLYVLGDRRWPFLRHFWYDMD